MEPTELFDTAFTRGCRLSQGDVRASTRFRELLADCANLPHPDLAAITRLLGESLITAGQQMLPASIRDIAAAWGRASATDQLILLELVYQELDGTKWDALHDPKVRRNHQRRQTATAVLPQEHGPWPECDTHPSCIGMGTLLISFAALAGAPHYYGMLLVDKGRAEWSLDLQFSLQALASLEQRFPNMASGGEFKRLKIRAGDAALSIHAYDWYTFHAVLVIQIADGRWVVVDPYLRTRYILDPDLWQLGPALKYLSDGDPRRVATISSSQPYDRQLTQWGREQGELDDLTDIITRRWATDRFDAGFIIHLADTLKHASRHPVFGWLNDLREDDWEVSHVASEALYSWLDASRRTRKHTRILIQQCQDDSQFARLCAERALAIPYRDWINRTREELSQLAKSGPHVSLELQHPSTGVAAAVLNNLRCFLGPRPIPIGGFLVHVTDSQAIWRDTMCEVAGRRHLDPSTASRLRTLETGLRQLPENQLHRLVKLLLAALDQERQDPHGRTWHQAAGGNRPHTPRHGEELG